MTKEKIAREAAEKIHQNQGLGQCGVDRMTPIILAAIEKATGDAYNEGWKSACHEAVAPKAAQPQRSEQFDPSKTEVDPVLERANELRRKYTDSKPHIVKEGSREHVIRYDSHGAHCSEPNCEINHFVPDKTMKLEWHDGPEFRKWMASSEIEDAYDAGYIAASRAGAASSEPQEYPNPTESDLKNPDFNAVWDAIKHWDISRHNDGSYSGPTGNDVMHILLSMKHSPCSDPRKVSESDTLREWTEYTVSKMFEGRNPYKAVADAHNAALKAEREESERVAQTLYRNIKESQQELASEQQRWADQSNKLYKMIQDRDKELAAERRYTSNANALSAEMEKRLLAARAANKPLVEALEWYVMNSLTPQRAKAALATAKDGKHTEWWRLPDSEGRPRDRK